MPSDHPDYASLVGRISRSFSANAVEVMAAEKSNSIALPQGAPPSHRAA